ncbi:hypothetical protein [Streptomyces longispororuber]|uniref:hypothetical protein n=1 Tax=Streptomyces longispororuber TaxID=68230 RepID=UPI0036F621F2
MLLELLRGTQSLTAQLAPVQPQPPRPTDTAQVWPDDDYPERIGIDILDEEHDVHGSALGADAKRGYVFFGTVTAAAVAI